VVCKIGDYTNELTWHRKLRAMSVRAMSDVPTFTTHSLASGAH